MSKDKSIQKYNNYALKLEEILMPLSSMYGIDNFFYTELFPDKDKAFLISNNSKTVNKLIQIGHFSEKHNDFISDIQENIGLKFVWPQDPLTSDEVGMMLKEDGIKSGISFLYREGNSIKNFGFASTNRSNDLVNILINNDGLFHHFIKYFESEANQFLKDKDSCLVNFKSISSATNINTTFSKDTECANSMHIKKLFIPGTDNESPQYMTRREYECVFLLCKGYSMKTIAHTLNLSPRTVEEHLNKCKIKFGAYNKYELINRALNMGIDKLLINK